MKKNLLIVLTSVMLSVVMVGTAMASLVTFDFSGTTSPIYLPGSLTGSVTYDSNSFTNDILVGSTSVGSDTFTYVPKPFNINNLNSIYVFNDVGSPAFDELSFFIGITGPNVTLGSTSYSPSYLVLSC